MTVLFKDIQAIDAGAQFLNADLHIHSYGGSKDVTDNTMTPQAIIDAAVAQGLSLIALTDHNTDTNIADALHYATKYADTLLFVPGVEVTTAHGHLLVYFAPERYKELSRFLAKLDLIGEMGEQNTHTAKSMSDVIAEAYALDGMCIAAHIDRDKTGFETLASGYPNWKRDIITSPGLYGIECDAPEHLAWYSEADEQGSAGAERRKLFEARASARGLSGRWPLARLQGSDAHSMEQFRAPTVDKPWTRIKLAELSFGALRTALIDPSARAVAKAAIPRTFPRVRGMAITGGFLDGEVIQFSDNLNCFIGGRGTGKTTALRSLAYCFGIDEPFGDFDSCPDRIVVYCEDASGVLYRYDRARNGEISVKVKEDGAITDVPVDSFAIEYFGQGELATVAHDPLNTPQLFQDFLDRHLNLRDLLAKEQSLVSQLRLNAARLNPLEDSFAQLVEKKKKLADVEKKLQVAEEGKLREIVGVQSRIASERTIRTTIEAVVAEYRAGITLAALEKDFSQISTTAGEVTTDAISAAVFKAISGILESCNASLKAKAQDLNMGLTTYADQLQQQCGQLKLNHATMESALATKIAALKAKGLAGNISELELLLKQKSAVANEITSVEQRRRQLEQCRTERQTLLADLRDVRIDMTKQRKAQLASVNRNLASTITDYKVFVRYDDAGIVDEFQRFLLEKMQGTYLQSDSARQLCERMTPGDLATLVLQRNDGNIAASSGLAVDWAQKIREKLCYWNILFELEVLAKPPKPIITVHTKSTPSKSIPVGQLSDGQRHTILLTIAMLAESNVPLVIDQPEDDLDNAFIFASVVATLRTIKERRQVILITHNANIAVLGDSELLLPMQRQDDCGKAIGRGSIDRESTKALVQDILEGGPEAFLRRQKIYGH